MDWDYYFGRLSKKIIYLFGESVGIIFTLGITTGAIAYLSRNFVKRLAIAFGVTYFKEKSKKFSFIGTWLIRSMDRLNADRVVLYRVYNGKSYIESNKQKVKIRSVINKTTNYGLSRLPEKLDKERDLIYIFNQAIQNPSFTEFFTCEISENNFRNSRTRTVLIEYGIESYLIWKIKDENSHLYGFVIYTWNNVRNMPKNLNGSFIILSEEAFNKVNKNYLYERRFRKNREYLLNLRNSVSTTFIDIIEMSIFEKFRMIIYILLGIFKRMK